MKDNKIKNRMMTILIAMIMLTALSSVGFSQDCVALLVQQSPPQGGYVSPDCGVHDIDKNGVVTLTATPKPGYQFAYWLGDVSDASSSTTVTSLQSPKMVIAVFERNDLGLQDYETGPTSAPNEKLRAPGQDLVAQTNRAVAGKRPHSYNYDPYDPYDPEDPDDDFPVPPPGDKEVDDGFPVPDTDVPEPMTILLLGLGSAFVTTRKRKMTTKK